MKIALCTPFKPVDHPSVSGDVTIARDLVDAIHSLGNEVVQLPYFPAGKLYGRPLKWFSAYGALHRMIRAAQGADCWLTYGSYYKVPDVFGPTATGRLGIPYFILQASYAENRGKAFATWPGYTLNKRAMLRADHIFCNRVNDVKGCAKILPEDRYTYVRPGLPEGLLGREDAEGARLREAWNVGESTVVVTAAMMRAGVKAQGVRQVFHTCARLIGKGRDIKLLVAGDGPRRAELETEARALLGDRVRFLGLVERKKLGPVFSAGDLFAFPGLQESIGMVYLEAQACGLPVVATDDEGAPHVVANESGGLITAASPEAFTLGVDRLVQDEALRKQLSERAVFDVEHDHNAARNYLKMLEIMKRISGVDQ